MRIVFLVCGILVGFVLCCLYFNCISSFGYIDNEKKYGLLEVVYYTMQCIGCFGTLGAVIVALFGKEIKNRIYSARCKTFIVDGGFAEDLGTTSTSTNPTAQLYRCTLRLENIGNKEINDLQLVIKEAYYAEDNKKKKNLSGINGVVLYWKNRNVQRINLREKESVEMVVARIYPSASLGTPDQSQKSPLRFSITGLNISNNKNKQGKWIVKYCIQTPSKIVKSFQIEYQWSGKWFARLKEMQNEVKVIINDIKK